VNKEAEKQMNAELFCFIHHFIAAKEAINDCLNNVQTTFKEQIKTLLNPKFQVFLKSATVTA
jgi:hypothetical protein